MVKIGSLKLQSNLILAPMSGITDLPFRILNRAFGAELEFVEMINVRSLGYKSKKTQQLLSTQGNDSPVGIQLLGSELSYIRKGLEIVARYRFEAIDFNAACPARKVTKRGEGASLLKDPAKLQKLLRFLVENCDLPVTVKIRSGWDAHTVNAVDVARYCQDAGIKALFIHGRTRAQEYSGQVDYGVIAKVKKALHIPVIASGDILSAPLAKKMLDETGCDGLLIARGALGNPWIFSEIRHYLQSGELSTRPSRDAIVDTMIRHFEACTDFYGPKVSPTIFRKFFGWYTKGFRKIRPLREESNRIKTAEAMRKIIERCRELS